MASINKVLLPNVELNMDSVTVVEVLVKPGDPVQKGAVLLSVESQKATFEVESEYDGFVSELYVAVGDEICEKAELCAITDELGAASSEKQDSSMEQASDALNSDVVESATCGVVECKQAAGLLTHDDLTRGKVRASPLARKMAKSEGIDLHSLSGSGPLGRIMRADIEQAITDRALQLESASQQKTAEPAVKEATPVGNETCSQEKVKVFSEEWQTFSAGRMGIIQQMENAVQSIPIFSLTRQMDLTTIAQRIKGLTLTHRLVACLGQALVQFPSLRTTVRKTDFRVEAVSVAVAMDTKQGLAAPAVRNPELLTLPEIAATIRLLKARGDAGQLKRSDFSNAPFALSNLGMYGIDQFQPSVFEGQSAVLGTGRAVDGAGGRKLAWFTLTCDHRIVDGVEAAKFLQTLQDLILNV